MRRNSSGAWFDYIRFNYRGKLFHLTTERERKIKRISDEINEKTGTAVKSITEGIEELKDSFRK